MNLFFLRNGISATQGLDDSITVSPGALANPGQLPDPPDPPANQELRDTAAVWIKLGYGLSPGRLFTGC